MAANMFVLKHDELEVEYTPAKPVVGSTSTAGLTVLTYRDGTSTVKSFTGSEVTTTVTGLGTLVSVALMTSADAGGERFGFFLPQQDVPTGEAAEFRTLGLYERLGGPDSIPHRDLSWGCVELHGTARTLIMEG